MVIAGALEVLAYCVVAYWIGRLIIAASGLRFDPLVRAGCVVIGAAAMAVQLWIYGALHIPWLLVSMLVPWIVLAIVFRSPTVAAARSDMSDLVDFARRWREIDPLTALLIAITIGTVGFYLLSLVSQPLVGWDAIAMWLFKAKVFYSLGAADLTRVPVLAGYERHLDYPPLLPLMIASLWVLVGQAADAVGKALAFPFLIGALWTAAALLRPLIGGRLTALVVFILACMPALQTFFVFPYYMGYADFPVAALILMSVAFLYRSVVLGRDQDSAMALLFAALAALTKNEGIPFLAVVAVALAVALLRSVRVDRRLPETRVIALAGVALVPVAVWQVYTRLHGYHNDLLTLSHPGLAQLPANVRATFSFYLHLMNRQDDYPWIAAAWIAVTVGVAVLRQPRLALVWLVVTLQIAFYGIALVFNPRGTEFELITAGDRLVMQVTPVVALLLALTVAATEPRLREAALRTEAA